MCIAGVVGEELGQLSDVILPVTGMQTGEKMESFFIKELRKHTQDSSLPTPQTCAQLDMVRNWMKGE
jgi:hypothetical protein